MLAWGFIAGHAGRAEMRKNNDPVQERPRARRQKKFNESLFGIIHTLNQEIASQFEAKLP